MQKDFENLFYEAEDHYLESSDLQSLKQGAATLKERLKIYQSLRDQEIPIFQDIAYSLVEAFPDENMQRLEQALKHWMSVMRYGAMAMLLNNPDYFRHRLLEWLTDVIHAQEMVEIETHIFENLIKGLEEKLTMEQMVILTPFLKQAKMMLLETKPESETLKVGA
ncbi:phycobilisome protein [Crocosphaera sp.]|uniref:phycobilisome protein n=1 Tax=Crocosphaera sp. TaxID=2729996 RepID=UPI0026399E07|nr:phycobilisome protein [Crocosphaera sp.]MDJ0580065.1 phycobilisome protein [Crocosphaera sp.]